MFMKTVLNGSPWDPECQEVMDLAMRYPNSEKNVWLWAFGDQDEKNGMSRWDKGNRF